jgi:hypothetical protein
MSSFENPKPLITEILTDVKKGIIQLPEFQRGWVWNENGIKDLIVSVLKGFPIGAIITLEVGGQVEFKPRLFEGVKLSQPTKPSKLILDGQQRITSLFFSLYCDKAVETTTDKNKEVKRFYYIDIQKSLLDNYDISDCIRILPETKIYSESNENIDLSCSENEFKKLIFPLNKIFDWSTWYNNFLEYYITANLENDKWKGLREVAANFQKRIVDPLKSYFVPEIKLSKETTVEEVCLVFEKVNTGGKPLDAFELITAMYAVDKYNLRKDWYGPDEEDEENSDEGLKDHIHSAAAILAKQTDGVLSDVSSTDFFQVISLLYTEERHYNAISAGKTGKSIPQISATKKALLEVPLEAYKKYKNTAEKAFITAGDFLTRIGIYRLRDLPYQSQVTALAAIISKIGKKYNSTSVFANLERWYWCGVFGELYGSSIETKIANDFVQVSAWVIDNKKEEPFTIRDANFHINRLNTMRSKLSAAYKGLTVLIAKSGAKDYITGKNYDQTIFMKENVDIDHIFPKKWCKGKQINKDDYDSIINKTPISPTTNRGVVSGKAPSEFIRDIENGDPKKTIPPILPKQIDENLSSHLIEPSFLRNDDFEGFFNDRREKLAHLIEGKMSKTVNRQDGGEY